MMIFFSTVQRDVCTETNTERDKNPPTNRQHARKTVWRHWTRHHHHRPSLTASRRCKRPHASNPSREPGQPISPRRRRTLETPPLLKPHGPKSPKSSLAPPSRRIDSNHHGPKSLKSSPHPRGFQSLKLAPWLHRSS